MVEKPHKSQSMKLQSRPARNGNQTIAEFRTYSASSEDFPSKNRITFLVQEPGYFYKNQEDL